MSYDGEQFALSTLSIESRAVLEPFYTWARQGRDRFPHDLRFEMQHYRDGRLLAAQYSVDEVVSILDGQFDILTAASLKEHEAVSASAGDLLRALLSELDRHQISPSAVNTQAVLSRSRCTAVELAEAKVASMALRPSRSLAPISALDRGDDVAKQLAAVSEDKRRLGDKLKQVTEQLTQVLRERSGRTAEIHAAHDHAQTLQEQLAQTAQLSQTQLTQLLQERDNTIAHLRGERDAAVAHLEQRCREFEGERDQAVRQVAMLTREMNGKLAQSSQFANMKAMLAERNGLVAHLRAHLRRYDPAAAGADDDIPAADDD